MKKIGLLCLALVLALGALGVGYAAWTDTVTISGTVNTGTLDVVIVNTSNTIVFKAPEEQNEILIAHYWEDEGQPPTPAGGSIIAYADADYSGGTSPPSPLPGDDEIVVTIYNAFPCVALTADFLLHYEGSIPVKVSLADITCDNPALADFMFYRFYKADEFGNKVGDQIPLEGVQMHYCDYVLVEVGIHLDRQDDADMNQDGVITGTITVIQWNEYGD